jgi:hypothetical protein
LAQAPKQSDIAHLPGQKPVFASFPSVQPNGFRIAADNFRTGREMAQEVQKGRNDLFFCDSCALLRRF